jgi:hypothetical protein
MLPVSFTSAANALERASNRRPDKNFLGLRTKRGVYHTAPVRACSYRNRGRQSRALRRHHPQRDVPRPSQAKLCRRADGTVKQTPIRRLVEAGRSAAHRSARGSRRTRGQRILLHDVPGPVGTQGLSGRDDGHLDRGATPLADRLPWKRFRTFVDIGCAQGAFQVRVALTHWHLRGTGSTCPPYERYSPSTSNHSDS